MSRRSFFKQIGGFGLATVAAPDEWAFASLPSQSASPASPLGLHPFIEAHPEAVFIRRTRVAVKTDAEAIRRETLAFARQVFRLEKGPGVSGSPTVAIKPNLTSTKKTGLTHAIITDTYAVEGLVDGLKELGVDAGSIFVREGLQVEQPTTGYPELARRAGIHYGDDVARTPTTIECPDGVVFRRTKYLGPFAYPGTFPVNVAKHKAHSMGLTLAVKNLQGTNIPPYIRFCGGLNPKLAADFQPDAEAHVKALFEEHLKAGLPRWETSKGAWMEMWAQRTIDHYALIQPKVGLHVIEGIYAQNGDAFDGGPGPSGLPEVFMTNVLIFGKDAFRMDIVGHWLGGHEPGNFGLFHLAKERGVSSALDPRNVPVYEWKDDGPKLTPLDRFERTALATPYLEKPGEPKFHMVDEPFAYAPEAKAACLSGGDRPSLRALGTVPSARGRTSLVAEYGLPADLPASVDVYDSWGQRVGVVAQGRLSRGIHAAAWDAGRLSPGDYWFRLQADGTDLLRKASLA
ncbi:MAG TPA: DUF362 domain-containing protein [Vicinamibacteria bacterium]|nr:DUF362 domain-containing protein [Vicinamibacteria bacterium]